VGKLCAVSTDPEEEKSMRQEAYKVQMGVLTNAANRAYPCIAWTPGRSIQHLQARTYAEGLLTQDLRGMSLGMTSSVSGLYSFSVS
jgi:hypothetical protein